MHSSCRPLDQIYIYNKFLHVGKNFISPGICCKAPPGAGIPEASPWWHWCTSPLGSGQWALHWGTATNRASPPSPSTSTGHRGKSTWPLASRCHKGPYTPWGAAGRASKAKYEAETPPARELRGTQRLWGLQTKGTGVCGLWWYLQRLHLLWGDGGKHEHVLEMRPAPLGTESPQILHTKAALRGSGRVAGRSSNHLLSSPVHLRGRAPPLWRCSDCRSDSQFLAADDSLRQSGRNVQQRCLLLHQIHLENNGDVAASSSKPWVPAFIDTAQRGAQPRAWQAVRRRMEVGRKKNTTA